LKTCSRQIFWQRGLRPGISIQETRRMNQSGEPVAGTRHKTAHYSATLMAILEGENRRNRINRNNKKYTKNRGDYRMTGIPSRMKRE
jgi:hypothetical protein